MTQQPQNPQENPKGKKTNLAPSALFVKQNVLDKFYPLLRKAGLVVEANQIIVSEGSGENDPKTIEFRIKCRELAQEEISKVEKESTDPDTTKKKINAWTNFSSTLAANVKPSKSKDVQAA
jgi:hypothetical protein